MDVILYNPRKFNGGPGVPVPNVFNPDGSQKEIILPSGKFEPLEINELKQYPAEIAEQIVERWGFVRKIRPEDLDLIKKEMTKKDFLCEVPGCGYECETLQSLMVHKAKKHKLTKEVEEEVSNIPKAKSLSGDVRPVNTVGYSPEGIPEKDVDGWYGPGEQTIAHTKVVRPGMPGIFGG
jgi:hypothetical protein